MKKNDGKAKLKEQPPPVASDQLSMHGDKPMISLENEEITVIACFDIVYIKANKRDPVHSFMSKEDLGGFYYGKNRENLEARIIKVMRDLRGTYPRLSLVVYFSRESTEAFFGYSRKKLLLGLNSLISFIEFKADELGIPVDFIDEDLGKPLRRRV